PLRRGDGRPDRRAARELPAGAHPPRAGRRGARARPARAPRAGRASMKTELLAMAIGALVAALTMTAVMTGARMLGLSRLSLPLVLGTMTTPNRDRAIPIGIAMHVVFGILFALPYFGLFALLEEATWWLGALLGAG